MANPQKEHGYTPIAHELLVALVQADLSGRQLGAALIIMRHSYGNSKKETMLSYAQIASEMGVSRRRAMEAMQGLVVRKIALPLAGAEIRTTPKNVWTIQKDYQQWGGAKRRAGAKIRTTPGAEIRTTPRTRASESSNQSSTPRTTPRVPDPRIGRLVAGFYGLLEAKLGEKPAAFNGGAAGKGFQKLLRTHQEPEIAGRFAPWFGSDDPFLVRRAYRVEDFFSNFNVLKGGSIHAGTSVTKGAYFGVESPVGKYAHLSGGPDESRESEQ